MTVENPQAQPTPFRAEVQQVLHILAHALYTEREIFLRELISNASDAMNRLQFEMLTNPDVQSPEAELAIRISVDEDQKTISITDTGIGMTADEMAQNLGTIAYSGARELLQRLEQGQRSNIIGQFGVGFYSVFMVADEVVVTSRSYRPEAQAAEWRSHGGDGYTISPAEREERGTTIRLHLKEEAHEFASGWRLESIIRRHSEFVAFPIYVDDRQVNQQQAIWRRRPSEVTPEEYESFYRQLTFDTEKPLTQLHLSTDAPVDLHAVLFFPSRRERGIIESRIEGKVKLYSRKVLIQEEARDLLPGYFRFLEGVVDSEDLPLNVSREAVQNTQVMSRLRKTLQGRLLRVLNEMAEKEAEQYAQFWREFGVFLKEGIATDPSSKNDLVKLLRFYSTAHEEQLISLAEYKSRMSEGQAAIYYVLASDLASARRSPHLDLLKERGLEALLLVEVMDSFMLGGLRDYEGIKLQNLDDPDLELPGESSAELGTISEEAFTALLARVRIVLGERISDVRASKVLRDSPYRLVAKDDRPGREMERVQRLLGREVNVTPRVLELNRAHAMVAGLARMAVERPDDPLLPVLVEGMYDGALLLEGLHPNPAEIVPRLQQLLEAASRNA